MNDSEVKIKIEAAMLLGKREKQQDYYMYKMGKEKSFAMVCDGMGGLKGGEKASFLVANELKKDIGKLGIDENIPEFLIKEIDKLDEKVFQLADEKGKWLMAGTTVVLVVIRKNELYWMTVGDSKLYIARDKEMIIANREHNYKLELDQLRKENKISDIDYHSEMKRGEQLISYLGMGNVNLFDVNKHPFILEKNDRILLCTDGVSRAIKDKKIKEILTTERTIEQVKVALEEEIRKEDLDNQDNATYVIIENKGEKDESSKV
jgi:protein phosphatase